MSQALVQILDYQEQNFSKIQEPYSHNPCKEKARFFKRATGLILFF